MLTLPASTEDVPLVNGAGEVVLYLRVKVLTVPEAAGSVEALQGVMTLARVAFTETQAEEAGEATPRARPTTKALVDGGNTMFQIAKIAVLSAAMPNGDGPGEFVKIKLTPNAESQSVEDNVVSFAAMDQLDTLWAMKATGVALRAATGAIEMLGKFLAIGKLLQVFTASQHPTPAPPPESSDTQTEAGKATSSRRTRSSRAKNRQTT